MKRKHDPKRIICGMNLKGENIICFWKDSINHGVCVEWNKCVTYCCIKTLITINLLRNSGFFSSTIYFVPSPILSGHSPSRSIHWSLMWTLQYHSVLWYQLYPFCSVSVRCSGFKSIGRKYEGTAFILAEWKPFVSLLVAILENISVCTWFNLQQHAQEMILFSSDFGQWVRQRLF